MSYIEHNTVVIVGGENVIKEAYKRTFEIFREHSGDTRCISGLIDNLVNGYASFYIAPIGSSVGWESYEGHIGCIKHIIDMLEDIGNIDYFWAKFGGDYADDNDYRVKIVKTYDPFDIEEG